MRIKLILAYFAIYVVWGSTYLAIRYALEGWPLLLMAGCRHLLAGLLLYAWARGRGIAPPTRLQWRNMAVMGALLLVGGNGLVVWAETRMSSGLTAVLVATEPVWLVILDWAFVSRRRPSGAVAAGLVLGFIGTAMLAGPIQIGAGPAVDALGTAAVVLSALSWGVGSLFGQRADVPAHSGLATSMQMLSGGTMLLLLGSSQWSQFHPAALSVRTVLCFAYLVVFGSLIGYSAYTWLLRVQPMTRVASYAYVNPVVAVAVGCALGGESLQPRSCLAAMVCMLAVAFIVAGRAERQTIPSRLAAEGC